LGRPRILTWQKSGWTARDANLEACSQQQEKCKSVQEMPDKMGADLAALQPVGIAVQDRANEARRKSCPRIPPFISRPRGRATRSTFPKELGCLCFNYYFALRSATVDFWRRYGAFEQ